MNTRRIIVLVAFAAAACSSTPPAPRPDGTELAAARKTDAADRGTASRSRIAIAIGRSEPSVSIDGNPSNVPWGAVGAAWGALAGFSCGPAALICIPIGAAIYGRQAPAQASEEAAQTAKEKVADASATVYFVHLLERQVERYRREAGIEDSTLQVSQASRYDVGEFMVEIAVTEVIATSPATPKLPYRFTVVTKGQLVRGVDNVVVDTFDRRVSTPFKTVEEWTAFDNAALHSALDAAIGKMVDAYLDEWILLFREEQFRAKTGPVEERTGPTPAAPGYVLRPIDPPIYSSLRPRPIPVSTLTPTFAWEKLPRDFGPNVQVGDIKYELRIYEAEWQSLKQGGGIWATSMVASYEVIGEPRFQVKESLAPCRKYLWTVRATFTFEGRRRVTEWSGRYVTPLGEMDPADLRRPTWPRVSARTPPQSGYFFPFTTPRADGARCRVR